MNTPSSESLSEFEQDTILNIHFNSNFFKVWEQKREVRLANIPIAILWEGSSTPRT